jgi:hypothetical protein
VVAGATLNTAKPTVRVGDLDIPLTSVKDVHSAAAG